jgi:acetyl esterase/lipase
MKRLVISLFCILVAALSMNSNNVHAQGDSGTYKCDTGIFYYNTNVIKGFERCRLDVYYPTNTKNFKTVVWFHGGGLREGNKEIPSELKNQNIAVIGVGYRLSPAAKCPAYIEDAAAAVAWVFKNIQKFGGDTSQIYVSGHSAGGYLTMMIGMDKRWLAKYNIDANRITGLIPFSGQAITHFTIRKERGIPGKQPIIDEYAPLYHVRADVPPMTLITGDRELELLGRYEETAYLLRMMKLVGSTTTVLYELDGFDHVEMAKPAFQILLRVIAGKKN